MKNKQQIWVKFFVFIKPFWRHKAFLLVLLIIGNCGALVSPLILKIIIDNILPNKDIGRLLDMVMLLSAIFVVRHVVKFCSDYLYSWISSRITCNITNELYNHILKLPLRFFKQRSSGDLLQRISSEVGQVQDALTGTIINLVNYLITIIFLVVLLCFLQWKLFLLIAVLYPLTALVLRYFDPKISKKVTCIHESESSLLAHFLDSFGNIKSIKTLNAFGFEASSVKQKLEDLNRANIHSSLLSSASRNISLFLITLAPVFILGFGGSQVINETLTLGALIAFLQYTHKMHEPFQGLINLYVDIIKTSVSLGRIFELFSEPVAQPIMNKETAAVEVINEIQFCGITKLHQNKTVLNKLDLKLKAGKKYAIVGPNGSGKSTLIELLTKLDEPDDGVILVNNIDLNEFTFSYWMKKVSVTHQNSLLFSTTVEENLTYGNESPNEVNFSEIFRRVNLSNNSTTDISLLETEIGDGGSRLSGGQRQKIALARALLQKAEIFIMDESTSEIDRESEEIMLRDIFSISEFNIVLIVSHNLSTLTHVDEIIYLDRGKVIEKGSLNSLIEKGGEFYKLFRSQLELGPLVLSQPRL